jgi:hypothetical protein
MWSRHAAQGDYRSGRPGPTDSEAGRDAFAVSGSPTCRGYLLVRRETHLAPRSRPAPHETTLGRVVTRSHFGNGAGAEMTVDESTFTASEPFASRVICYRREKRVSFAGLRTTTGILSSRSAQGARPLSER